MVECELIVAAGEGAGGWGAIEVEHREVEVCRGVIGRDFDGGAKFGFGGVAPAAAVKNSGEGGAVGRVVRREVDGACDGRQGKVGVFELVVDAPEQRPSCGVGGVGEQGAFELACGFVGFARAEERVGELEAWHGIEGIVFDPQSVEGDGFFPVAFCKGFFGGADQVGEVDFFGILGLFCCCGFGFVVGGGRRRVIRGVEVRRGEESEKREEEGEREAHGERDY